jgi:hypothetical protein
MYKDLIIMTKSDKHGGFCVVGIDINDGSFIRLMSNNKETFGALTPENMLYEDNSEAKILDVARVEILKPYPTKLQPENVLIDEITRWQKLGTVKQEETYQYLNQDASNIFLNVDNYLSRKEVIQNKSSILFVQITNAQIYSNFKNKTKMSFTFKGSKYTDMSVTDPDYYDKDKTYPKLNVVFSLPDDKWSSVNNKYYKFAAKIFEV